jgi:hypothetical protein
MFGRKTTGELFRWQNNYPDISGETVHETVSATKK